MAATIENEEPEREYPLIPKSQDLGVGLELGVVVKIQSIPDIPIDVERRISAPDEAAAEEDYQKTQTIVKLCFSPCHTEFIEEPMNVEKRCGEFI